MGNRNRSDEATVAAVVAVIPHDKYISLRYGKSTIHGEFHRFVDIWFIQRFAIAIYMSIMEGQNIATLTYNTLNPYVVLLS